MYMMSDDLHQLNYIALPTQCAIARCAVAEPNIDYTRCRSLDEKLATRQL